MQTWRPFLLVLAASCLAPDVCAAGDPAPEKPNEPLIRRIYDVSDLIAEPAAASTESAIVSPADVVTKRNRATGAGGRAGGGGGGGLFGGAPTTSMNDRIEALVTLIRATAAAELSSDNNDSRGSITPFGRRLVITAAQKIHANVEDLLRDLRANSLRGVRIRVTWAALAEDELRSVLVAPKAGAKAEARVVDMTAVEKLKGAVRFRCDGTGLNGRTIDVMAGRARSVLTSLDAVVGNSSGALEPTIELVLSGAMLRATPVLSGDAASVTLDLRAVAGQWDKSDLAPIKVPLPVASGQPAVSPAPPVSFDVERINTPIHAVAASVKVPVGVAVIVGGATPDAEPKDADAKPVYLIVETWTAEK